MLFKKDGEIGMTEYIIKVDENKKDIMGNCPLVEKPQKLVRCKDCKHWMSPGIGYKNADLGQCMGRGHELQKSDWFCADGERK